MHLCGARSKNLVLIPIPTNFKLHTHLRQSRSVSNHTVYSLGFLINIFFSVMKNELVYRVHQLICIRTYTLHIPSWRNTEKRLPMPEVLK
jgi:hypothetical protein